MLLRGQNLLGYRNYADDVVEAVVKKSIENGIDVLRIFDALNDVRNLSDLHPRCQGGRRRGPGRHLLHHERGAHRRVLRRAVPARWLPPARTLSASRTWPACSSLPSPPSWWARSRPAVDLPLELHTHATAGIGEMTPHARGRGGRRHHRYLHLVLLAAGTSQPCTESMAIALEGLGYKTGLDMDKLEAEASIFAPRACQKVQGRNRYAQPQGHGDGAQGAALQGSGRHAVQPHLQPGRPRRVSASTPRSLPRFRASVPTLASRRSSPRCPRWSAPRRS